MVSKQDKKSDYEKAQATSKATKASTGTYLYSQSTIEISTGGKYMIVDVEVNIVPAN